MRFPEADWMPNIRPFLAKPPFTSDPLTSRVSRFSNFALVSSFLPRIAIRSATVFLNNSYRWDLAFCAGDIARMFSLRSAQPAQVCFDQSLVVNLLSPRMVSLTTVQSLFRSALASSSTGPRSLITARCTFVLVV